jgi:hypothetical protein
MSIRRTTGSGPDLDVCGDDTSDDHVGARWERSRSRLPVLGTLKCMAHPRRPDSVWVPIGLKVSKADAARIEQVLARPEFAGWTRAEWCREIVRSALRYYAGDDPVRDPGEARVSARPVAAAAVSPGQAASRAAAGSPVPAVSAAAGSPVPAVSAADTAAAPGGSESVPAPEPPAQLECSHPADARDYETGTCAACGSILWD